MDSEVRDPTKLARAVIIWIHIHIGAQLVYLGATWLQLMGLSGVPAESRVGSPQFTSAMEKSDIISGVGALVLLVTFLVSGFLILKWIYRTNANAHHLSSEMSVSPGWNIGWFFIPVANLWMPFRGIKEIWQVSHQPRDWEIVPIPALMHWWWGLWLLSNFIDNASFRLSLRSETATQLMTVAYLDIISCMIGIPVGLLLVSIVRRLTRVQAGALDKATFE